MLIRMSVKQRIAKTVLSMTRWKLVVEQEPPRNGSIMLGVPHTSYFDGVLMICIAWSLGLDIKWLGKKALFKGPMRFISPPLGGIPVDRGNATGMVKNLVDQLNQQQASGHVPSNGWALVITPEGTRSKRDYWKSGFYRIALATNLPVVLGFVDRRNRTTGLGPTLRMTGEPHADMDRIRAFYKEMQGVRPGLEGPPRLRMEDDASQDAQAA